LAQRSGPGRGCWTGGALPAGSEASSERGGESRIRVFRSVRRALHSPVTWSWERRLGAAEAEGRARGEAGVAMTLAARLVGGRAAWTPWRLALPLREVMAAEAAESQHTTSVEGFARGEGLAGDAELAGRTESYLPLKGSALPRCWIAERKGSTGDGHAGLCNAWRAFAQAVRHLYRVASTGWTEPPDVSGCSSSTRRKSLPEARVPWEKSACAATALESRVESPKKRVCSESGVLSGAVVAGEDEDRMDNDGLRT
jgi:hypothetical protein